MDTDIDRQCNQVESVDIGCLDISQLIRADLSVRLSAHVQVALCSRLSRLSRLVVDSSVPTLSPFSLDPLGGGFGPPAK